MSQLKIDVTADARKAKQELKDSASAVSSVSSAAETASARTDRMEKSLKDAAAASSELSDKQSALGRVLTSGTAVIAGVTAAIAGVVAVSKDLISVYSVQEQAEVRLEATLRATGNAISMSSKELRDLASSFQEVTTYGDEAIIEVEKLFVASGSISRQALPRATEAVLDLAAAMGEDLNASAKRLAKALADPKSNLDSLKDANIQLSDAQKEEIKALQEQGDLMGAQSIILEKVESSYGGIAKALADTDTGKLTQISNAWGDIKEGLGKGLLDSISPALDVLYEKLTKISAWITKNVTADDVIGLIKNGDPVEYKSMDDSALRDLRWEMQKRSIRTFYSDKDYAAQAASDITEELRRREYGIDVDLLTKEEAERYYSAIAIRESGAWAVALSRGIANEAPSKETKTNYFVDFNKKIGISDYLEYVRAGAILDGLKRIKPIVAENPVSPINDSTSSTNRESSESPSVTSTATSGAKTSATAKTEVSLVDQVLKQHGSKSRSARISDLDSQIADAYSAYWSTGDKTKQAQIQEIITALKLEKQALLEVADAEEEVHDASVDVWSDVKSVISPVQDLISSLGDMFEAFADNAEAALSRVEAKWDDYFDELDRSQSSQQQTYAALLSSGEISYDEYIAAMNSLDEKRAEAIRQQQEEEDAARDEANRLGEAAFNAKKVNSLASIAISTAEAIMAAWADDPNPVVAGIMTGIISAAALAQTVAVSSQSYTPLAAGGITQGPQKALIGEGGVSEMILPLTEGNLKKVGINAKSEGNIVLNLTVENAYTTEDLSESVFRAIERAQRTGALPKWRYA